jgi:hypothetical protein
MNLYRKLSQFFDRKITVLILPQAQFKAVRWQASAGFILFVVVLWGSFTAWAGFIVSRHVDYWITKADNQIMLAKMSRIAEEVDRSRGALEMAKATDQQLRVLLSLARREDDHTGVGGPTTVDRGNLQMMLNAGPSGIHQADWHKQLAEIRAESYRRLASFQEIAWYISNQRSLYHAIPNMWPTEGQITALFGYRLDPIRRSEGEFSEFHSGIDIANSPDTLIYATADGTVRFSGWSHGYGQMIVIDHGYGLSTLYGHTAKALVHTGDRVERGQIIAYMGTTGRSTGAHLHYEVWRGGRPINPQTFLQVRSVSHMARLGYAPSASER